MLENIYQSNNFEVWQRCQKQYWFKYVKKLAFFDSKEKYDLGRNIHSLIFYKIKGFDISKIENSLDEKTLYHWNYIKNHQIFTNKNILAEWGFNVPLKNKYWLIGRIDAIFYDKNRNKYIIADWKTAQQLPKSPDKNFQALMYMYCFFKARHDLNLEFQPEDLEFQFISTNEKEGIELINCSKQLLDNAENLFIDTIEEINTCTNFAQNKGKECQNCPYLSICES